MPKNLLQIVQATQAELGLPMSSTVIGNTDATTVQMLYLANRVLDELRRENEWAALQTEWDFVINPPIITTGTLTQNSPIITGIPSTTGLIAQYFTVAAPNVPVPARLISVDSATQVTMDMEATGTTTNTTVTFCQDTYAMPTDLDWNINQTFWDRTNRWALFGPDSPQLSQWLQSGIVPITPRRHFRQIGPYTNSFRIWPPPAEIVNPLQLVFEYISINAVRLGGPAGGGGTGGGDFSIFDFGSDFSVTGVGPTGPPNQFSQYFINDTDTPLLDDQAIILGLKWMFWEVKGFNYVAMQSRYIDYVQRLKARDGAGSPTLKLARRPTSILISPSNIQDGNFPGSPAISN